MKSGLVLTCAWACAFISGSAGAQVPVIPNYTPPPTNLDPGSAPVSPTPTPPAGNPKPNVVVLGPNGEIVGGPKDDKPQRFHMGGGTPSGGGDGESFDEPQDLYTGAVPELHVVRTGDTLWDICWYYFNDPWQWPKIWSYNPQITNPHWIYPGDLVRLLPRGVFATPDSTKQLVDPEKTAPKPADNIPPPAKRTEVSVKQIAFVEQSDLDRSITIEGSVDEKVLLGPGDQVYLTNKSDTELKVGQRYSIYLPDNSVKSNGKTVGAYVKIYGTLEVASIKTDKKARGVIVDAYQEITRGLKVGPLVKSFHTVPPSTVKVDAQGAIVAMLHHDALIGQGEVVFVDLGKQSGVEVGNRMFVVRRGDAYPKPMDKTVGQDDRRFPARALGEVVIVEVGDRISIGLITLSVQEMAVGDLVMMQKQ